MKRYTSIREMEEDGFIHFNIRLFATKYCVFYKSKRPELLVDLNLLEGVLKKKRLPYGKMIVLYGDKQEVRKGEHPISMLHVEMLGCKARDLAKARFSHREDEDKTEESIDLELEYSSSEDEKEEADAEEEEVRKRQKLDKNGYDRSDGFVASDSEELEEEDFPVVSDKCFQCKKEKETCQDDSYYCQKCEEEICN